jgi:iron(III) transport system substrate-binding protein
MKLRFLAAGLLAFGLSGPAKAGTITAYSAYEEAEIAAYLEAARKALPDVRVNVLRLPTGDLGPRILAEAANPRADVIWGFAVTSMLEPRIVDMLEPYQPRGAESLPATYRAADSRWFAPTGYIAAYCINKDRLAARGLPVPHTIQDLADPRFKGEVVMPSPVSSGTGYMHVSAILQGMGEDRGWQALRALDANIAQYTRSGSAPCRSARAGEYTVGLTLAFVPLQAIEAGFPVQMVIPQGGAGYELEASGLMRASRNKSDAQRFLDWTMSQEATALYAKYKELVTIPGFRPTAAQIAAGLPADLTAALLPMDVSKAAQERSAILARWQREINR